MLTLTLHHLDYTREWCDDCQTSSRIVVQFLTSSRKDDGPESIGDIGSTEGCERCLTGIFRDRRD